LPGFLFKKDTWIPMSKILIIDDEEKLRSLPDRITRLEGYEVLEAGKYRSRLTLENVPLDLQVTNFHSQRPLSAFGLASVEKLHIQRMLIHTKANKTEIARLLNIAYNFI
jgi:response regulator RpfG family c-di-GMP phosphodiesterase